MTVKELGDLLSDIEKDIVECEEMKMSIEFRFYLIQDVLRDNGLKEELAEMIVSGMKTKYPDYFKD